MAIKKIENFIIRREGEFPLLSDLFLTEEKHRPIILYLHGYKGFKDWGHLNLLATAFAEADFNFMKFNFSHNGGTLENPIDFPDLKAFSENNYSIELNDAQNAINWLFSDDNEFKSHMDLDQFYLMGHSRGGGIAILTAAQDKRVKKLATWSAVSDFERRFPTGKKLKKWKENGVYHVENFRTKQNLPHKYQFFEDFLANRKKLDIPAAEKQLQIPHLLIHGTKDEAVFLGEAIHLMSLNDNTSLIKIPEGTHTFGAYHPYDKTELPEHVKQAIYCTRSFFQKE